MTTLPSASTTIAATAGSSARGVDLLTIIAPVGTSADTTPRTFVSTTALLAQHGFCQGVDYAAMHFEETGKPVLFVGVPIVTAGVIGQVDTSGHTGTGSITLTSASGVLDEVDLEVTCTTGGTAGTSQIKLSISTDGGRTEKAVRLGTGLTYAIPYTGLVLTVSSGAVLVADDVILTARATAPRWDQAGVTAARTALAAQSKASRNWLVVGDLVDEDDATDVLTEINSYATANDRFLYARTQAPDYTHAAKLSKRRASMTTATLTFAEVGGTGDTITRVSGSFITDGFAVGDVITVAGSVSNNVTGPITALSATVITFGTTDLAAEASVTGCTIVGSQGITFAEVGGTGDTITRVSGSWVLDGFVAGDIVTITGTASNNVTTTALVTVTALVITLGTTDLAAEEIASHLLDFTTTQQTLAASASANDTLLADIDDSPRIDIAHGRGRKLSPITGYRQRLPAAWAASLREYLHDVQIPSWRKADGACFGWDLEDENGNTVEHDERITGGALAGRFTCLRSWANGPAGTFVALSLTRALDDTLLSRTHNEAVANVACSTVQASTENAIGVVLQKNADGTATEASLSKLEGIINGDLERALLADTGEGSRASSAKWSASRADDLSVLPATLTGTLDLVINGTVEQINTTVRVS